MAGERVLLALEAWKVTAALRMLGRCYRLCFLLFTEKGLIELETDVLRKMPPTYAEPYGGKPVDHPLDLLWSFLDSVLWDVVVEMSGIRDEKREREEVMGALSGDELDEVLRFLRGYLAPRMKVRELREGLVASYAEVERVKVRRAISVLRVEVEVGGKRLRYEVPLSSEEAARLLYERFGALGLPNLESR